MSMSEYIPGKNQKGYKQVMCNKQVATHGKVTLDGKSLLPVRVTGSINPVLDINTPVNDLSTWDGSLKALASKGTVSSVWCTEVSLKQLAKINIRIRYLSGVREFYLESTPRFLKTAS